ncbi:RNA polymerase sigma factor [Nesterenkonia salmonea]|uniref:RNA polymerase sigma factor n=1 Tax=Nesterenkonia salmonea TaxID=1804987 RepID=A0A5R9BA50_9MICC|nr:RNA polymerase sigma factor [Nesterenkonia salmonea]TLP96223.1 RNA polymerase sigma factor [Nesterenkonia salmonea]
MTGDGRATAKSSALNDEGGTQHRTVVLRAMDGDIQAFEALVDQYQGPLSSLCRRMVRDVQEAEDIVQETFITVWRRLETLQDPTRFKPWIYRLASNACIDLIRKRESRRSVPTDTSDMWEFAEQGVSPERSAVGSAAVHELEKILNTLPPEQKLAWILFEMQGESYAQIADILKISEGSVRGRIHRARRTISEGMEVWL